MSGKVRRGNCWFIVQGHEAGSGLVWQAKVWQGGVWPGEVRSGKVS
jgi:hypothetical protein